MEQKSKLIGVEKADADEALSDALPALEAARLALDDLERSDITEIRSFATPPEAVQIVCECVVIIKGIKEVSWKSAKAIMSEVGFLKSLTEMNCDIITSKQVASCRAHMIKCSKLDEMKQISKAGNGLLKFVLAVLGYCDVFKEIKPKKERVQFLETELDNQVKMLQKLNTEIASLESTLDELSQKYNDAMAEKQELQESLDEAERRLVCEFFIWFLKSKYNLI